MQMRPVACALVLLVFLLGACRKRTVEMRSEDAGAPAPIVALPPAPPTAPPPDPLTPTAVPSGTSLVREETRVLVDGVEETWRLEWRTPPVLACVDATWSTCICLGFAFGEEGEIDLVRMRPGRAPEKLDLGRQTIQRWRLTEAEKKMLGGDVPPPDVSVLRHRPTVKVMKIGDYDHDGRATELVLQNGAGPCFHTSAMLVGIERKNDSLHVFEQVGGSLLLSPGEWEKVRESLPRTFVAIPCGDHGAEEETKITIFQTGHGLRTTETIRRCAR